MQDFIRYITAGCIAFTVSCLFYLLCSVLGFFPSFNNQMVLNMFCLSIAIIVFIYLTHLLPIEHALFARVVELLSVLLVLLFSSFFYNLFPLSFDYLLLTLSIGALTYFIVITVIFVGDYASAKRINHIIRQQNEGAVHDKND